MTEEIEPKKLMIYLKGIRNIFGDMELERLCAYLTMRGAALRLSEV